NSGDGAGGGDGAIGGEEFAMNGNAGGELQLDRAREGGAAGDDAPVERGVAGGGGLDIEGLTDVDRNGEIRGGSGPWRFHFFIVVRRVALSVPNAGWNGQGLPA